MGAVGGSQRDGRDTEIPLWRWDCSSSPHSPLQTLLYHPHLIQAGLVSGAAGSCRLFPFLPASVSLEPRCDFLDPFV